MSLDVMVAEPVPASRGLMGAAKPNAILPNHPRSPGGPTLPCDPSTSSESSVPANPTVAVPDRVTPSVAHDFLELTKPRIVTMILVTTLIAAVVAAGSGFSGMLLLHLLVGVAMVAGSAGAMNQVWERKIDGEMERTRRRPLPSGRMSVATAAWFSIALGIIGTAYLIITCGPIPAIVGVVTWITYVPIYTPLKTRSSWNTTVGAVSGALPVLIGYTAAGGSLLDVEGWLLFGVLAAWQYPHFMAIAWLYRRQYGEAGFQMSTTVEPTGRSAGWQSVLGMVALVGCLIGLALGHWESSFLITGAWIVSLVLVSYPMTKAAWMFARERNDGTARKLLRASLLQLPVSLLLVTAAALLHG